MAQFELGTRILRVIHERDAPANRELCHYRFLCLCGENRRKEELPPSPLRSHRDVEKK